MNDVVMEISGEQVRLGIAAPKDLKVLRDELLGKGAEDFQWRAVISSPAGCIYKKGVTN